MFHVKHTRRAIEASGVEESPQSLVEVDRLSRYGGSWSRPSVAFGSPAIVRNVSRET